jgi:hypothetical protein
MDQEFELGVLYYMGEGPLALNNNDPELNPILGYKPDFMSSIPEFTFAQPEGDRSVVDFFDLMEIPLGTNIDDAGKIIAERQADVKSFYIQSLQLVCVVFFLSCLLFFFLFIY